MNTSLHTRGGFQESETLHNIWHRHRRHRLCRHTAVHRERSMMEWQLPAQLKWGGKALTGGVLSFVFVP